MKLRFALLTVLVIFAATAQAQTSKPKKPKADPAPEPKDPTDLKPVAEREIDAAIQRGIALLIADQESLDGPKKAEWPYEGVYRVDGKIPIGYRIGGTSICALALIQASGPEIKKDARAAIDRAFAFVLERLDDPLMSTDFVEGYDVRGWGHAYALSFLLGMREAGFVPEKQKAYVDARIKLLIGILQQTQIGSRGGWNYARGQGDKSSPSTFMTAPTLQILFEARRQGEIVDDATVERALQTLEDARFDNGAFQYGSNPKHKTGEGFEAVAGSIGRAPICETTLYLAGRGSLERIQVAVDSFFLDWRWLEQRRRQNGTHIPPYFIAPYYFFYAHRFVAQAIELLPEEKRPEYRKKLYELLWHVREEDGGWNDRVFPRSENFGTAMTMIALLQPHAKRPAGWAAVTTATPAGADKPKKADPDKPGADQE